MASFSPAVPIAQAPPEARTQYMTRVYVRLLVGLAGFVLGSMALFVTGLAYSIASFVLGVNWLLILGGFMLVSWMSATLLARAETTAAQYAAYAAIVTANVVLFATPLVIAQEFAPEGTITLAAQLSVVAFIALSVIAIRTAKDFSFLRGILLFGGVLALLAIVASTLFGVGLGIWFAVAMIGYAGAAILYDTQKVYRTYPLGTETAAAVRLFSSLTLLFWYVLQALSMER
ncbi:MAG: Bax inhibitor-1 family protein [Nitriliruptoraceae bacterium]